MGATAEILESEQTSSSLRDRSYGGIRPWHPAYTGCATASEVDAGAVLRDRRLRCGLDTEPQAGPLRSVDRQDERVLALLLEDQAVEGEREGRRPPPARGGEGGFEGAAPA